MLCPFGVFGLLNIFADNQRFWEFCGAPVATVGFGLNSLFRPYTPVNKAIEDPREKMFGERACSPEVVESRAPKEAAGRLINETNVNRSLITRSTNPAIIRVQARKEPTAL